jgi:hypothetical protein
MKGEDNHRESTVLDLTGKRFPLPCFMLYLVRPAVSDKTHHSLLAGKRFRENVLRKLACFASKTSSGVESWTAPCIQAVCKTTNNVNLKEDILSLFKSDKNSWTPTMKT